MGRGAHGTRSAAVLASVERYVTRSRKQFFVYSFAGPSAHLSRAGGYFSQLSTYLALRRLLHRDSGFPKRSAAPQARRPGSLVFEPKRRLARQTMLRGQTGRTFCYESVIDLPRWAKVWHLATFLAALRFNL
jgi:hypothetical protein